MIKLENIIDIYLQPIFYSTTKKIKYSEALIRPKIKGFTVKQLLSLIERQGLSVDLDIFILRKICIFITKTGIKYKVSVNMSRSALETVNYADILIGIMREYSIKTNQIAFEIHEETNFSNVNVQNNLTKMYKNNCILMADDFGKYNTDVAPIFKFNIQVVKFDKSALGITSREGLIRLGDMVSKLHTFGISTIIEGVETKQQLNIALQVGYRYIQGFLLGRPQRMGVSVSK